MSDDDDETEGGAEERVTEQGVVRGNIGPTSEQLEDAGEDAAEQGGEENERRRELQPVAGLSR